MKFSRLHGAGRGRYEPSRTDVRKRTRKERYFRIIVSLAAMIGLTFLLYPTAAQWLEQRSQSVALSQLGDTIIDIDADLLQTMRQEVEYYNEQLAAELPPDKPYETLLNYPTSPVMSRLRIPVIDLDQPVYHGMTEEILTKGLGHMKGSSLPIGGTSTRTVIGGHRGSAEAVGFTHLDKVSIGDRLILETLGRTLSYQVTDITALEPKEAEIQPIIDGKDLLTLVTCTPLGINTERLVITGERVATQDSDGPALMESDLPRFPWWLLAWASALAASTTWTLAAKRSVQRREHHRHAKIQSKLASH